MTNPINLVHGESPMCETAYQWKDSKGEVIPTYKVKLLKVIYKNDDNVKILSVDAHDRDIIEKIASREASKTEDKLDKYLRVVHAHGIFFIDDTFLKKIFLSNEERKEIALEIEEDLKLKVKYSKEYVFEYEGKIYTQKQECVIEDEIKTKKIDGRNGGGYKTKKPKTKKELRGEKDLFDKIEALPNLKFKF